MSVACPHCGFANEDWASFCTNCGRPLRTVQEGIRALPPGPGRGPTRTGLLLMILGVLISAVPFVSLVGFILLVIGVLLLLTGARTFGARHRRLVVWSILLYILIAIATAISFFFIILQVALTLTTPSPLGAIETVWRSALVALGLVLGALTLPFFLITWELQDEKGRRFLWLALTIDLVGTAALVWYLSPFAGILTAALEGDISQLLALASSPLLLAFPLRSLVWAYPYFLAHRRVSTSRNGSPAMTG
ncbi:MAG: zinc ribbon domain-containing protein [Thermoplasmata archaeon]